MEDPKTMTQNDREAMDVATFYVRDALFGLDILRVQEINRLMDMTHVHQAPDYVLGILNLRGQIVTIIDLGKKLGLVGDSQSKVKRNIVVPYKGEFVGLQVDRNSDVVHVSKNEIEPAPANLNGVQGHFIQGVYTQNDRLVAILDVDRVLEESS